MEPFANRRRRPEPNLVPSQKVWLLRRHISTTPLSSKLDVRRPGPYPILGPIGRFAYKLLLPPSMKIHHRFHVSLLEPHVANTFPGRDVALPLSIQVDGFPEFEVNKILSSKFRRRKLFYLVDWVGYDASEHSWETAVNPAHATLTNQSFHARFPLIPGQL